MNYWIGVKNVLTCCSSLQHPWRALQPVAGVTAVEEGVAA